MFEIICISKVISAGYLTDINSHVELPAPSRRPGATKPARGDTPVAAGEFKVNGIIGLWFGLKRRSRDAGARARCGRSSFPRRDPGRTGRFPTDAALGAKKLEERKHLFALKNDICSFPPAQHQTRACRNVNFLLLLSSFSS